MLVNFSLMDMNLLERKSDQSTSARNWVTLLWCVHKAQAK